MERKLIDRTENILIISAMLIFILNYTIAGVLKGSIFSPLKNIIMLLFFFFFAYRFFSVSKDERRQWFSEKFLFVPGFVWLILYFAIRCISFCAGGLQYGVAREIFFEFIFLVALCRWTVGKKLRMDILAGTFCLVNLVVNLANTYCCHVIAEYFSGNPVNETVLEFLKGLGSYSDYGADYNLSILYVNPNSAGIMTAFAIILSFFLLKNRRWLPIFAVYWLYSLYTLYSYEARGAEVSFIVAVISFVLILALKRVTPKRIVGACLIGCFVLTICIYAFIGYNLADGSRELNETETAINNVSSQRYVIWQDCFLSHSDKRFLGTGSPALEKHERNEYLKESYMDTYGTVDGFLPTTLSVHNGYLAAIFITGWAGFLLLMIIMGDKISKAKALEYRNEKGAITAAVVIFALMVCNFEALFVTSRYFTVLMMFVILAWDAEDGEGNKE